MCGWLGASFLGCAVACGSEAKTEGAASEEAAPEEGETGMSSDPSDVPPMDDGTGDDSGSTDTSTPPGSGEPSVCPDRPVAASSAQSVVLHGDISRATGFYALPDPFYGTTGMVALAKIKKHSGRSKSRIQLFWSIDGLDWLSYETCSIRQSEDAGWSSEGIGTPSMLVRDDGVWVWYRGDDEDRVQSVGLTTSVDGCDWLTTDEAVFTPSEVWARQATASPHVIERDGLLWMYYTGSNHANQSDSGIGLATSEDGTTWTVHPDNPIIPTPEAGWNSSQIAEPHVWQADGRWLMLYAAHDNATVPEMTIDEVGVGAAVGLAASWDGESWSHCYDTPLLTGGVKVDQPFVWTSGSDTIVYYRLSVEEGTGGEIQRVTWSGWPTFSEGG